MLLRPGLPLLAVLALLGPATARAAGPAPDVPPPPAAALHPDPVPAPDHVRAPARRPTPVQPAQRIVSAPAAAVTARAPAVPSPAKPTSHRVKRHAVAVHPTPVHRVVDVTPLFVDVPVGLGEVASSLRDKSSALLAAIALLAAAAAAASGVALTFVWGKEVAS